MTEKGQTERAPKHFIYISNSTHSSHSSKSNIELHFQCASYNSIVTFSQPGWKKWRGTVHRVPQDPKKVGRHTPQCPNGSAAYDTCFYVFLFRSRFIRFL